MSLRASIVEKVEEYIPISIDVSLTIIIAGAVIGGIINNKFGPFFISNSEVIKQSPHPVNELPAMPGDSKTPFVNQDNADAVSLPKEYLNEIGHNDLLILQAQSAEWKRERGYFQQGDYDLYASYDEFTLVELAKKGDLLALDILANLARKNGDKRKSALLRLEAAAYGSTSALTELSTAIYTTTFRTNISDKKRHDIYKNMLAYSEVAAMRGDRLGVWSSLMVLNSKEVALSDVDIQDVTERAEKIYGELEKRRERMGLSSFDNTTDKFTEITLDFLLSPIPNPNNWAEKYIRFKLKPEEIQ